MRILIVEDDPGIRDIVTEYLVAMGHAVDAMGNGREALEQLRAVRSPYDVALVDWLMPGITGRDVVQGITAHSPTTAVLITTGQASNRLMQQISRDPRVSVMPKPFTLRALNKRVLQVGQRLGAAPAPLSALS